MEGETSNMLIIHQISYDYNGDIIACTASNRVGRTRREMTLKVECELNDINIYVMYIYHALINALSASHVAY